MDLNLIGNILLSGMELWSTESKKSFTRKHKKILKKVADAQNAHGDEYTDSQLALSEEELESFYKAYLIEQNNQVKLKKEKAKK